MNHTIQGLSNDMEGGMKHYYGVSRDYGSGFMETIMGSNLVHLMVVRKRDSLPIRLGSRWILNAFDVRVLLFGSAQRYAHGGDP